MRRLVEPLGGIAIADPRHVADTRSGQSVRPRSWAAATAPVRFSTPSFWNRL